MLQETIEPAWLDAFEAVPGRCALQPGDTVAVLSESPSRPILPELSRLAAARRDTLGHFDLPLRHCTVTFDGAVVVDEGRLA